jgi:hypothetical protein
VPSGREIKQMLDKSIVLPDILASYSRWADFSKKINCPERKSDFSCAGRQEKAELIFKKGC